MAGSPTTVSLSTSSHHPLTIQQPNHSSRPAITSIVPSHIQPYSAIHRTMPSYTHPYSAILSHPQPFAMFSHTQLYSAIRSHTQQDSVIPCSRTQPYSSILSRMVAPKLRRFVFDVFSRSLAFSIFLLNLLVNCVRIRF